MPPSVVVGDLERLRWTMEPDVDRRTGSVAFVVSGPDAEAGNLAYDVFLSTGPGGETRAFETGARSPRWSPDGTRIALLRRSGSRWVPSCRTVGGDEVSIPGPSGSAVDLDWSPDAVRLAVVTTSPAPLRPTGEPYREIAYGDGLPRRTGWIVQADTEPVWLADDVVTVRWSPDGTHIAAITDDGVERARSLAHGIRLVGSDPGETLVPATVPIRAMAWSPDGSHLAYLAAARDNAASALLQLWIVDVANGVRHRLGADLDRSIGLPVRGDDERAIGPPTISWTADGAAVLAIYADGGRSRIARFGLDGGRRDLVGGERAVLELALAGDRLVFSWSASSVPGELSLIDLPTGDERQLTDLAGDTLGGVELAPTRRIAVVASDGVDVEGWLTLPRSDRPVPLVLQVHGGPHYGIGERFSFDAQRLAGHGIALLRANPRGSQGYGRAYADGNLGDWGGRDLADLLGLVEEAVRVDGVDEERVAVIGESYGGYMAAWAAATTDRFTAAVIENGISDFLSAAGGPIGPTFWHAEMGGAPWENPTPYLERSVITRIDAVDVPVLIIHCEADTTCPIAHGEAMYHALGELGRGPEFLRVPGEDHFFNVFGSLARRLERTRVLDDFLVRHLQRAEEQPK
ncbi:MAG TPA: S9 family peptidase [Acidimicrobiia bacterium]|nr:S9 family peptidase [Acidimicrobiia bacterium]